MDVFTSVGASRRVNPTQFNDQQGYTFIHAALIIVIIGILVAMIIPRGGRDLFNRLSAYTAAHQIGVDMRYTRRMAITTAKEHIVRFYPVGAPPYTEYRIFRNDVGGEVQVGESKQLSSEVTCSGNSEFTFQPQGNATADGSLSLIAGGYQYNVNLLSTTGRVAVQKQ